MSCHDSEGLFQASGGAILDPGDLSHFNGSTEKNATKATKEIPSNDACDADVCIQNCFFDIPQAGNEGNEAGTMDSVAFVGTEQAQTFDNFCFDFICSDREWPSGSVNLDGSVHKDDTISTPHIQTQTFQFIMPDDQLNENQRVAPNSGFSLCNTVDEKLWLSQDAPVAAITSVDDVKPNPEHDSPSCEGSREKAMNHKDGYITTGVAATTNPVTPPDRKEVLGNAERNRVGTTTITNSVTMNAYSGANAPSPHSNSFNHSVDGDANLGKVNPPQVSAPSSNERALDSSSSSMLTMPIASLRVPCEGIEELLRRAHHILVESTATCEKVTSFRGSTLHSVAAHAHNQHMKGANVATDVSTDALFSAQISHWLRRGAEMNDCALTTVSDLQLQLTRTMQLFATHSTVSTLLGPQYSATPVVLTLPLAVSLLESLLKGNCNSGA
ncbi:hypothetical protein ERJ75_001460200 [Trypanosoma vivax]|nr:hypothetical protein TRVL_07948 [Trypanosoma vivax]KAH8607330.1 hypothetical protein ERJ75_001460200 [Trypanosoma vivax]